MWLGSPCESSQLISISYFYRGVLFCYIIKYQLVVGILEQSLIGGCHCSNGGAIETSLVVTSLGVFIEVNGANLWQKPCQSFNRLLHLLQYDRRCKLRSHNKMYELNGAENDQLLDAPIQQQLHCLFIWQDCVTITVTTWDTWNLLKNLGLLKLHLVPLLLWILMLCCVRPCWGWPVSVSAFLSSPVFY